MTPVEHPIFNYISTEFAALRERLDGISRDNATVLQEIKAINREQHRQSERIDKLEKETREKMASLEKSQIDMVHILADQKILSDRLAAMEVEVKELRHWKATKQASWLGPKNILAAVGATVPLLALASAAQQIFGWITQAW